MNVGFNIRHFRKQRGMTLQQLAGHMGLSPSAVYKYENGRTVPNAYQLSEICEILQVTPNQLLSEEPWTPGVKTNGDLLREMDDESLGKWLCHRTQCNEKCIGYELCTWGPQSECGCIKWCQEVADHA